MNEGKVEKLVSKKIEILDCTLRDGGYVNNWEFDNTTACGVVDLLQKSGIEYIELGIMGKDPSDKECVKFRNFKEIEKFLKNRSDNSMYTVILNYSEKDDFVIPHRSENTVECIRLAFFKKDWEASVEYARDLIQKGYLVFLQAMVTSLYTEDELRALTLAMKNLKPYAFYIVDSFGTLYNEDVVKMAKLVDDNLDEDVIFGFHAHNNIQLAFSNIITFIHTVKNHRMIVDSSVYGMGRGAGNLTTELISQYLNRNCDSKYNMTYILKVYEDYLQYIFRDLPWGYTMDYFVTSSHNINPAYAWYYMNKKDVHSVSELNGILENIPREQAYTLFKDVADEAKEKHDRYKER